MQALVAVRDDIIGEVQLYDRAGNPGEIVIAHGSETKVVWFGFHDPSEENIQGLAGLGVVVDEDGWRNYAVTEDGPPELREASVLALGEIETILKAIRRIQETDGQS
ncbi:MAG TPA: hypothetical protein VJP80_03385 [Candidatus Saccharimonadales bacterium]|nr:hypothetical protein [Candidatus Saccharimonadales bacterium]